MNLKKKIYQYANSTNQRCPKEKIFPFATGVNDTGGASWAANISANFQQNLNSSNGIIRGLGETDPCRKLEVENLVALSL